MSEDKYQDRCKLFPLEEQGCICGAGSDISGPFICTKEYSKTCQWANEERIRNGNGHNSSK